MSDEKRVRFASFAKLAFEKKTLKNLVFSSSLDKDLLKIKMVLCENRGSLFLRCEYFYTEGRVRQENVNADSVYPFILEKSERFMRCDLNDSGGSASLMTSKKGKLSLVKHGRIGEGDENITTVDREKKHILSGCEEFLYHLGISDKNGRVHDKKQSKFRQINRFLEYVEDVLKYLPKEGALKVADLCCGKSYLSFAVYYYLTVVCKREVVMDCMDLKESVMYYCADVADKCGFTAMRFTAGDVTKYESPEKVHLVISLHACDTATDIVLERAVAIGATVILSTPCCHRALSRELDCRVLDFACQSSVLKSKMCDALTDSLRLLRLEAEGYRAQAVELIDPEDTPKNVLIRAYKDSRLTYGTKKADDYKNAYKFLTGKEAPLLSYEKGRA